MLRAVIIRSLIVILVILLLCGVMVYFAQDGMIYQAPAPYTAAELKWLEAKGVEPIEFETGQGKQVDHTDKRTAIELEHAL